MDLARKPVFRPLDRLRIASDSLALAPRAFGRRGQPVSSETGSRHRLRQRMMPLFYMLGQLPTS
jgi:hypothetical protein